MNSSKFINRIIALLLFVNMCVGFSNSASCQMRQVYVDNVAANQINKLSFYSPSQGYVAFRDWIGYTSDSGRTFTKKYITNTNVNFNGYSVNLTFGFNINGVKAFNQNTILVYGDYGLVPAILRSTNGGNNFTLYYHSQFDPNNLSTGITDMIFPQNTSIGYAIDADRILKTTNQGLSWISMLTSPNSAYDRLDAIDDNTIFAISDYSISDILFPNGRTFLNNKIDKSTNAGGNWTRINTPTGEIRSASFITASRGWVNVNEKLYFTNGFSWNQKNNSVISPFYSGKIRFINDSTGFAISDLYEIIKTTDSGRVWEPLPRDNNFIYGGSTHNDLQRFSTTQIWAGGGHGFLEMSTNGGGVPLPKALFQIDTVGVSVTNIVKLNSFSKRSHQHSWYVNGVLIGTSYNTTFTHNVYVPKDTIQLVVSNGSNADTLIKIQDYNYTAPPLITSFTPTSGPTGTVVMISGFGFTGTTSVKFGGIPAASFVVNSFWSITAVVDGGLSGDVSVTTAMGTGLLSGFIYLSAAAPSITSFYPGNGPVGTTVTIFGSNFSPIVSENVVYFGKVKAPIVSATNTQIVCTVPPGASFAPIVVVNILKRLSAYSVNLFSVTFPGGENPTPTSFTKVLYIPTDPVVTNNIWPLLVSSADIDGDGKNDIIANVRYYTVADSIFIYRNTTNGNISFAPRKTVGVGYSTALGDLDGDGKLDIASINNYNEVRILKNSSSVGNVAFVPIADIPVTNAARRLEIRDLDGDGRPDIILSGWNNSKLGILMNVSTATSISFSPLMEFPSVDGPFTVAVGDLSGDGKPDVIVSGRQLNTTTPFRISVFKNTSTPLAISFAPKFDLQVIGGTDNTTIGATSRAFIADANGDGKLDIILNNGAATPAFSVFRNTSTANNISFATRLDFNTAAGEASITGELSNFRGDSLPDFISGNYYSHAFNLHKNLSTPSTVNFNYINYYGANGDVWSECASDLDGDGKQDVIVASAFGSVAAGTRGFDIYKNQLGGTVNFSVCEGGNTSITSTVTGGSYQWQLDTGSGFANLTNNGNVAGAQTITLSFTNIPMNWNGYKFRCVIGGTSYSSIYLMKVKAVVLPTISISTPSTTVCYGSSVTFTANANQGNAISYSYMWLVNNVDVSNNSLIYTTSTLNNNDNVKCLIIAIDSCSNSHTDTSNIITMTIYGGPNSIVISTPNTSVCQGTTVTFTATIGNGLPSPSYQWYVNGGIAGTNSNTFTTSALNNNDGIHCLLTFNGNCTSQSNSIIMSVTAMQTPAVVISTPNTTICSGTGITFTAAPTNGGTNPAYQWQLNGINTGGNSNTFTSNSLNNNDQIQVRLTSNAPCVTTTIANSNVITMTVNNVVTPSVSISASNTSICSGTLTTFTAAPVNGGATPSYQWQVNSVNVGTNSNTFVTATLNNNDQVKVILTSSLTCASPTMATSNIINMSVIPIPIANAGNDTTICSGTGAQLNGAGGTTYSWSPVTGLSNPNIANPIASPVTTTRYYLTVTNGGICAAIDSVLVTVTNSVNPSVSISTPNNNICSGTTVTFSSSATGSGSNPSYQWQVNGINTGTNSNSFTTSTLNSNDQVKVILTSSLACASPTTATSNIITVVVSPLPIANAGNDVSICAGSSTQLQASGGATYLWTPIAGLSNPNIANPTASPVNTTTYTVTVSNGINCSSQDGVVVTVNQPTAAPTVSISTASNNICAGTTSTFNAVPANGGSNPAYQWQVNGINAGANSNIFSSNTLTNNSQVKVILTSNSVCVTTPTATSNIITMNVSQLSIPLLTVNGRIFSVTNPDASSSYTWQVLNGTAWNDVIPTAIGIVYTATAGGEYRVKAIKGGCMQYSVSEVVNFNVTYSHFIDLYPNPGHNFITIDSIALIKKYETVEIIDMHAKRVLPLFNVTNRTNITIDISMLSKGMYMAIVRQRDGTYTALKFIKQ